MLKNILEVGGCAGLRVGYGLLPRWIADEMWRVKQPYNVNVAAQIAVAAVFEEMPYLVAPSGEFASNVCGCIGQYAN